MSSLLLLLRGGGARFVIRSTLIQAIFQQYICLFLIYYFCPVVGIHIMHNINSTNNSICVAISDLNHSLLKKNVLDRSTSDNMAGLVQYNRPRFFSTNLEPQVGLVLDQLFVYKTLLALIFFYSSHGIFAKWGNLAFIYG